MTAFPLLSRSEFLPRLNEVLPGITLVATVTAAAYGIHQLPGFGAISPMFSAILIGMAFANFISVPHQAKPGISLLGKKMLRLAVALLGLQLTLTQVMAVGVSGMAALVAIVILTYGFTLVAAKLLGVEARLARLLAAGTSICGASAIAAANSVERANDEDVAYAIACVTLFGTLAIVVYPLVASLTGMDALSFGFWTGASVHEVSQVTATGFQQGVEAGEYAVVVKLSRVLLLAPLLIALAMLASRRRTTEGVPLAANQILPVFVAAFILFMLANTLGIVPEDIKRVFVQATPVMLTGALGALGLGTHFGALRAQGVRPMLLAAIITLFISLVSLSALTLLS